MEFRQESIATLHDFGTADPDVAVDRLAVVVPVVGGDVDRRSVARTFETLATVDPGHVVIPFRGTHPAARRCFRRCRNLGLDASVVWCNGPAVTSTLEGCGIEPAGGKGLDVWIALAIATERADYVVVHDADAYSYAPSHVPRLAWPLTQGASFVKGYYARIEDERMYGRVTRLLWEPLMAAIRTRWAGPAITYLDGFRYPLAGEVAMTAEVARELALQPGWGLEVGMLLEAYRQLDTGRIVQVDLGNHRHDHRPVHGDGGIVSMAEVVAATLIDGLRALGHPVDRDQVARVYRDQTAAYVDRYALDAAFNDLNYDRAAEEELIDEYHAAITAETAREPLPSIAATDVEAAALAEAGRITPGRVT